MENKDGHEGAQANQPSSSTSRRRQREEEDSNQSNQRRWTDETSTTEDINNSSNTSFSLEDAERYVEEALHIAGQMDMMQNQMEEEESSVSNEGWNSNQSNQHRLVDETSATEDGNSNSSSSSPSFSQEDIQRLAEQALQAVRQMDAMQNQQGTITIIAVGVLNIDNADGSVRTMPYTVRSPLSLNIDGMSYEELTALEERIGIVKTGLSKDNILKQLKTRVHTTSGDSMGEEETEICTVCQDKYENQDKIATLGCKHEYHQDCITKWLVRKNLCPICKGQALKTMEESKKEEVVNEC
ncbi:E3 ubiquitin-protein ligase RLIM-like [Papaver somniferum]|uniref:E3 ubiquitin-protein ligase RLIM-like n=1 Tax=Papaver somniferum TaxID=3469 RepID=UPI000E6F6C5F|nr:E3 ubiquitin-protein ligase RLIM-like [Papaver somniferum]